MRITLVLKELDAEKMEPGTIGFYANLVHGDIREKVNNECLTVIGKCYDCEDVYSLCFCGETMKICKCGKCIKL